MPNIFNYTVILSVSSCLGNHIGIFCTVLSVVGNINSSTPSGSPQTLHRFDKGVFLCNLPWCGNKFPKHFVLFSRMVLYLLINFHMFCGHHCICDFQLKVHLCDFHSHKFSIAKDKCLWPNPLPIHIYCKVVSLLWHRIQIQFSPESIIHIFWRVLPFHSSNDDPSGRLTQV